MGGLVIFNIIKAEYWNKRDPDKNKPLLQEEEVEESRGLNDSVCAR